MVDTQNAHIRKRSRPGKEPANVEVISDQVAALADLQDNEALQQLLDTQRNALIVELERFEHDGSSEMDARERELCRELRLWRRMRMNLTKMINTGKLRTAQNVMAEDEAHTN